MLKALSQIWVVARQTFCTFFVSPIAYVIMIIFLVLGGLYGFMLGNFMAGNDASLYSFFDGYRWVFLILIPPMGMHMWSEEMRAGTFEMLVTLPITTARCVIGKFLGALGVVIVSLALTFPLIITVCYLGKPDMGIIVTSYIGAVCMAMAYIALCSMASAMTRNQSIAFVLGMLMCVLLNLFGLQSLNDVLTGYFTPVADLTQSLSVRTHYIKFLRGIIDTQNLYYFLAVTLFGLFATNTLLWIRRSGGLRDIITHWTLSKNVKTIDVMRLFLRTFFGIIFLTLLLVCGAVISHQFRMRTDLTEDNMFTLSKSSVYALQNIEKPTVLRLYMSRDKMRKWPVLEAYAKRIEDLLEEYRQSGNGKIKIEKYDVQSRSVAEESAIIDGLTGVQVENIGRVWFGLVAATKDQRLLIPDLIPMTEARLEYEITRAILQLNIRQKPRVALWSPLPVAGRANQVNPLASIPPWAIVRELNKTKEVHLLPKMIPYIDPQKYKLVVIIHPSMLTTQSLYALDQYILSGGRVIFFCDPNCYYAAFAKRQVGIELPENLLTSEFTQTLPAWGIQMAPNAVAADMTLARVDEESRLRDPCVLLPNSDHQSLNRTHPATQKLRELMMWYTGYFEGKPRGDLELIPLVTTTKDAAPISKYLAQKRDQTITLFKADGIQRNLAIELRGHFPGIFVGGRPAAVRNFSQKHISQALAQSRVVLVGDVDMLFDAFNGTTVPSPFDPRVQIRVPSNDNTAFFFNLVDDMLDINTMINIRGERALRRPFTRLQVMKSDIEQNVIEEERSWINELYKIEKQLSLARLDPMADPREAESLEKELNKIIDTLTNINIYRDKIANLENELFFWNVIAMPTLVGIFGLIFLAILFYRRRAR